MSHINRTLIDPAMDDIDHALGRPAEPLSCTYRDHYAVDAGSQSDLELADNPYWQPGASDGRLQFYHVTEAGRCALAQYLRKSRRPPRAFAVTVAGLTSTVWAETRSKARYDHWLDVADCFPDWRFGDFLRHARVRAA
jgi:hypothetical protein